MLLARFAELAAGEDVAIGEPRSSDGVSSKLSLKLLNELLKVIPDSEWNKDGDVLGIPHWQQIHDKLEYV